MIFDRIKNASLYMPLGERIAAALKYAAQTDFLKMPDGRHDLCGDQLFALLSRYQTRLPSTGKWEAHRRYADLQYIIQGQERFGVGCFELMTVIERGDPQSDCLFLEGPGQFLDLTAGSFLLLMPDDVHMPGLAVGKPSPVTKVVIKILLD